MTPGRLLITPRNCSGRRVAFDLRRFAAGTAAFTEVLRRGALSPAFVLLHGKGLRRFTAVHGVGRGNGVGRGRGVGVGLGVVGVAVAVAVGVGVVVGVAVGVAVGGTVGVAVAVGVDVAVAVAVGVGVGEPDCAQYLAPVLVGVAPKMTSPPQTTISLLVQTAV